MAWYVIVRNGRGQVTSRFKMRDKRSAEAFAKSAAGKTESATVEEH